MGVVSDIKIIKRGDVDYLIAEQYYRGRGVKEVFANSRTAAVLGKTADKYQINIAKRGVDGVLDKLVIEGWSVDVNGQKNPAAEETFKRDVWDHNNLESLLPDALEAAETYGDAYLLTWPVEDEGATAVDVFLHKPIGARMFYDPGNEMLPTKYVRTWLVEGPDSTDDQKTWLRRVNVITGIMVEKLISNVPAAQATEDANFVPFDGEDPTPDPDDEDATEQLPPGISLNPYGRIPVAHLRTRRPYGVPEHECLYGCQNLLLKVIATLGESVDGFGIPWRYRTLSSDKSLKGGGDVFDQASDDEEDDADRVRTRAGELANLWDTDQVGQLTPADSKNLLEPIDKVMQLAATVSTTPLDYFDASAASASGESKKEHKGPYLAKVLKRQKDFSRAMVADCLEFALVDVLGFIGAAVTLVWQALIERTDAERYEQIGKAVSNGVPWAVACVEAGYSQETVDEWIENGWAPDDSPAARVELFKGIAEGTKNLAAAANLGGIDATTAQALIQQALARPKRKEVV